MKPSDIGLMSQISSPIGSIQGAQTLSEQAEISWFPGSGVRVGQS